jgi:lipoate-protein ligase A
VAASEADGLPRGVSASYRHLGAALLRAYRQLGVDAEIAAGSAKGKGSGACYLAATQADLSLAGAKLSGSAQVWREGACLQHGSFVVSRDVAREAAVFHLDAGAEAALAASTVTIEGCTGERRTEEELVTAVVEGFEGAIGIVLEAGSLTRDESADAARLEASATLDEVRVRT